MISFKLNSYLIKGFVIGLVIAIFATAIITMKPAIFQSSSYIAFLLYLIASIALLPAIYLSSFYNSIILQVFVTFLFWISLGSIFGFILTKSKNKKRILISLLIFVFLFILIASAIMYLRSSGTYQDKEGKPLGKCILSPNAQIVSYYYENKTLAKTCFLTQKDIFSINYCDNNLTFYCDLLDIVK